MLSNGKGSTSHFLLRILHLSKQLLILLTQRLHCVLQSLDLQARVTIVCQDVFFLNFKSTSCLLRSSFLLNQLRVLRLQKLVCVGTLSKFLVDESVLAGQRLNILCDLCDFLGFQLSKLCLLLGILFHVLVFLTQSLDLLFSFKKLPLIVIILADNHAHLVLNIAEL